MPGQRHLPIINKRSPDSDEPVFLRGIISPCTGCQNNTATPKDLNADMMPATKAWPCPKTILYAHKEWSKKDGELTSNFSSPIYDEKLRGINPTPAGVNGYTNGYSYAYIATYEDNVDNGWNPNFNTQIIRCRGPYLLSAPERLQKILGSLDQHDHILAFSRYYFLDGVQFKGFAMEAATWQVHTSDTRRTDTNLGSSTSGGK